jgi:hypothetical protein
MQEQGSEQGAARDGGVVVEGTKAGVRASDQPGSERAPRSGMTRSEIRERVSERATRVEQQKEREA